MLTDSDISPATGRASARSRHSLRMRHARSSTHASSVSDRPICSAAVTSRSGATAPRSGWNQRRSASPPVGHAFRASTSGWTCSSSVPSSIARRTSACRATVASTSACMEGSNARTALRPADLARYIATSACWSRSSRRRAGSPSASPSNVAMPMDGDVACTTPSRSKGAANASRTSSARSRAASAGSRRARDSSSTNSSPPSRATVTTHRPPPSARSPMRHSGRHCEANRSATAFKRAATPTSRRSPRACPCRSFRSLKLSRSTNSSAPPWPSWLASTRSASRRNAARLGRPVRASA